MSRPSSLPPLKENDGKYVFLAVLLIVAAGALLWFFLGGDESEPPTEAEAPAEPAAPQEDFAAAIEIPPDEELDIEPDTAEADKPRRAGESPAKPSANPADAWECNGTINPAQARAVIKGSASKQVQTCYERGLKGNNLLQGSLEVELTIGASGAVNAVSLGGTLRDRQVHSCVKRVAKTWKFPKPTGGCVRINVPFQLTPKL